MFDVGGLVNALLVFAITVAVICLLVVLPMNSLIARRHKDSDEPVPPDVEVLLEIRDLLREQRTSRSG